MALGRIKDTTDHVNTTMLFKSKLTKNFQEDNYWIDGFQNKVDQAWAFASDVVDIKEEIDRYNVKGFRVGEPMYKDIEVRITSVYDEKGKKLPDDYKNIIFKDVNHKQLLGRKYLFDMEDFTSSDEKKKCTWLDFNFDTLKLGANSIIRRCNAQFGMLIDGNTTEWYEPAIIDYDPTYTISYFSPVLNVPKSEIYAYLQFNEYTKNIKMSDRFIVGALDFDDKSNNSVYKVKEIFKMGAKYTENPNSNPMIVAALERDIINVDQDLVSIDEDGTMHYIADYYIKKSKDNNKGESFEDNKPISYYLKLSPGTDVIYEGNSETYECYVYDNNDNKIECSIEFTTKLNGTSIPDAYYGVETSENKISITNYRRYFKSDLILTCKASDESYGVDPLSFSIQLGEKL